MIEMTSEQTIALEKLYSRSSDGCATFEEFEQRAQPMIGGDGCIIVGWCGMFVGIEADGYTHT